MIYVRNTCMMSDLQVIPRSGCLQSFSNQRQSRFFSLPGAARLETESILTLSVCGTRWPCYAVTHLDAALLLGVRKLKNRGVYFGNIV